MKITILEKKEVEATFLKVQAGVRYWEDATVNGVEDNEGDLIPLRDGDYWCPKININSGVILNWPVGIIADIHYKVCDDGTYTVLNDKMEVLVTIDGYVPNTMCPEGGGFGDYIIMKVDSLGKIKDWEFEADDFLPEDE